MLEGRYWSTFRIQSFVEQTRSLVIRFQTKHDLYVQSFSEIPRFLTYVCKRLLGKSNLRMIQAQESCTAIAKKIEQRRDFPSREIEFPREVSPWDAATNCFQRHGFYPISFVSINSIKQPDTGIRPQMFSRIIPGVAYEFFDEDSYYDSYANSEFAFTYKKNGWDSFRNLEIISSGAVPLYLDAKSIPRFIMTFYPKEYLSSLMTEFRESQFRLSHASKQFFFDWCLKYLQTQFLYEYLRELSSFSGREILFLDDSLDGRPDYMSMMVLISLVRHHDSKVYLTRKYRYLTEGTKFTSEQFLYGRGFGYRGRLVGASNIVFSKEVEILRGFTGEVVIGNVNRNMAKLNELNKSKMKTISIWGEDFAPRKSVLKLMQQNSHRIFIRELNHPFVIP